MTIFPVLSMNPLLPSLYTAKSAKRDCGWARQSWPANKQRPNDHSRLKRQVTISPGFIVAHSDFLKENEISRGGLPVSSACHHSSTLCNESLALAAAPRKSET